MYIPVKNTGKSLYPVHYPFIKLCHLINIQAPADIKTGNNMSLAAVRYGQVNEGQQSIFNLKPVEENRKNTYPDRSAVPGSPIGHGSGYPAAECS